MDEPSRAGGDEIVGRHLGRARNVFDFFGYAITVVTWISFCGITLAILYDRADALHYVTDMPKGAGKVKGMIIGAIGVTIVVAVLSSLWLFFLFFAISAQMIDSVSKGKGFWRGGGGIWAGIRPRPSPFW